MRILLVIIGTLIFTACCDFDLRIPANYRDLIFVENLGETIYFENQLGELDTIRIHSIDSVESCGPPGIALPVKVIKLRIEHLPRNNWPGGFSTETGKMNQPLVSIDKVHSEGINLWINYRDFSAQLPNKPTFEIDTLRDVDSEISELYFSRTAGLLGYQKTDGTTYNRKYLEINNK